MKGFNVIAEKINDSVPSTNRLYEAGDIPAIIALAKKQVDAGCAYVDVNIGAREPKLMEELVRAIQGEVDTPLSIDSPSYEIAEIGLKAYDPAKAGGKKPILNSVNLQRKDMIELVKIQPMKAILIADERVIDGESLQNEKPEDVFEAAKQIHKIAADNGLENDDIIFDPTVAPIGADMSGLTRMTIKGVEMIGSAPEFKGCHQSVGLSNFTAQLPSKKPDGSPVKLPLKNAFLTICVPQGLDMSIASAFEEYKYLDDDDPALKTVKDVLELEEMEILMRVQEFYS